MKKKIVRRKACDIPFNYCWNEGGTVNELIESLQTTRDKMISEGVDPDSIKCFYQSGYQSGMYLRGFRYETKQEESTRLKKKALKENLYYI